MKPPITDPEADAELDKAIDYYEQQQAGLGGELRSEVNRVIGEICKNPFLGAPYQRTKARHFPIQRFPFVIYYMELTEAIWIIAIAHGKRRPGYWKKRLSRGTSAD